MSKRKKRLLILAFIVLAAVVALLHFRPQTPLSHLQPDQIDTMFVYAMPPEEKVVLSEEQSAQAVELLQNLQISRKGYRLLGAGGQTVKFTLVCKDGTGLEVVNFGNAVICIGGQSYKADYHSAHALSTFANQIIAE